MWSPVARFPQRDAAQVQREKAVEAPEEEDENAEAQGQRRTIKATPTGAAEAAGVGAASAFPDPLARADPEQAEPNRGEEAFPLEAREGREERQERQEGRGIRGVAQSHGAQGGGGRVHRSKAHRSKRGGPPEGLTLVSVEGSNLANRLEPPSTDADTAQQPRGIGLGLGGSGQEDASREPQDAAEGVPALARLSSRAGEEAGRAGAEALGKREERGADMAPGEKAVIDLLGALSRQQASGTAFVESRKGKGGGGHEHEHGNRHGGGRMLGSAETEHTLRMQLEAGSRMQGEKREAGLQKDGSEGGGRGGKEEKGKGNMEMEVDGEAGYGTSHIRFKGKLVEDKGRTGGRGETKNTQRVVEDEDLDRGDSNSPRTRTGAFEEAAAAEMQMEGTGDEADERGASREGKGALQLRLELGLKRRRERERERVKEGGKGDGGGEGEGRLEEEEGEEEEEEEAGDEEGRRKLPRHAGPSAFSR